MKEIVSVTAGSPAQRAGIRPGDGLLALGGQEIMDALDYRFFGAEAGVEVTYSRAGETCTVRLDNEAYEDLGMEFATYLMDKHRSCCNNCVFCFVDQLPKGMRSSLYFKDDDERLSLLFGNYVTLTNLKPREFQRIIDLHISPINVSVHATDPEVRVALLRNRFAGDVLDKLRALRDAGLAINCQLVICPGINDGAVLERSLEDLTALGPEVRSIAVIPIGLTCHREGLAPLRTVTPEEARAMIALCDRFGEQCLRERGLRTVYAADELYLLAGLPLPDADHYDGFPQLDNGVGMCANTRQQFTEALSRRRFPLFGKKRQVTLVTGTAAADLMRSLVDELRRKCHNKIVCSVLPVQNRFFGETVTVSGLLTGQDIAAACRGKALGDCLIIPGNALKSDAPVFLDDMSMDELSRAVGVPVLSSGSTGADLLAALCGDVQCKEVS